MSKVTRTICDRCGKDITDAKRIGHIEISWQEEGDALFGGLGDDFCEACIQDVLKLVTKAQKVQEPPAEKKPEEDAKEKKIDEGKMLALYKAGWTQRQIAEELGIPQTTVSYRLKKLQA